MSRTDHARPPRKVSEHDVRLISRPNRLRRRVLWASPLLWVARCSCGEHSEDLPSKGAAQTWRHIHLTPGEVGDS